MSNHYKYHWNILDGIPFYMCHDISFYKEKVGEALAKGQKVFMPMENNNDNGVMQDEADRWQKDFSNAEIQWLDKSNTNDWYWLKAPKNSHPISSTRKLSPHCFCLDLHLFADHPMHLLCRPMHKNP